MSRLFPPEARPALLIAAMVASAVLFVFAVMAVRMAWRGPAAFPRQAAEAPAADPAVLRARWADGVRSAQARLGSLPNRAQRDAVEADLLGLRVAAEDRERHLRLILGLRTWESDGGAAFQAAAADIVGP